MSDHVWIKVLPGNVLKGSDTINKDQQLKVSEPCRMLMEKYNDTRTVQFLKHDGWVTLRWKLEAHHIYEVLKFPPMTREFTSLAVKGSVWEFERDWIFQGYDASPKIYTIKAGTKITIANNKMPLRGTYSHQEKYIEIVPDPIFEIFGNNFIPAKEVSAYLKLVTAGKVKTYWRLEKADGTQWIKKNFGNLGNVKASIRVRFNLVKPVDDEYFPDHLDNSYGWMERPNMAEGVFAVQYNHASKKEIFREDMQSYIMTAVLSA
jgi:hypothetical protein